MEISIIIRTCPEDAHRLAMARRFIHAAIKEGCTIRQCFFQSEGVLTATQAERLAEWQQIADDTKAEMLLCSQAVEEYAIDPETPFQIGGLGALVEAAVRSDRLVSFV
tara:strand:+ start:1439 stop:1762 length:324 start_codon:yes stop_codon:yes gene_type:complete